MESKNRHQRNGKPDGCWPQPTGVSPRPMLMGAPRNALRAFNAGVSMQTGWIAHPDPPFRADHGAPFAGLCSVQIRYPVAYEVFKVQSIRTLGACEFGCGSAGKGSYRSIRAFPRRCTNSPLQKCGKGASTLLHGLNGIYATMSTLKSRILVISFVSNLRRISSSTQRCGTPFSS